MENIPNMLSALRILLIPFFVWQFTIGNNSVAGFIILLSGITDFFDGYLARRNGWITPLGKVLDPAADKLTLIVVSVVLILNMMEYKNYFIIILIKDLVMLIIGGFLLIKDVKLDGAKWFGKIGTALFYGTMVIIFFFPNIPKNYMEALLSIVVVMEIFAAILYTPDLFNYLKNDIKG